ncbi:MAG TPA: subclass B3 metallo-beta-lactamase [Terriglobia bacterium]|nr:subclass B3 metallo-beta-lactamase [Terriglobia bacterium]
MRHRKNTFVTMSAQSKRLGGRCALLLAAGLLAGLPASAQEVTIPPRADNTNFKYEPFRMIGNIYWVGHSQVGAFLIKTSQGLILMDSTSAEESDWTRENIEKLGYKMRDIKIMLNSHPHAEHMGGFAKFKELSGARLIASRLTAEEMAVGGRTDFREDGSEQYTPVRADQIIEDGGKVTLGEVTLTAHLTPGHTKGCTTWTTTVEEDGKTYNVVFFCGMATAGIDRAPLLNNPKYPNIVEDYQRSFKLLRTLPCDVPLYPRATTIHMQEKHERLKRGEKPNPFVDPALCKGYIDEYQGLFEDQLRQQLAAAAKEKASQ